MLLWCSAYPVGILPEMPPLYRAVPPFQQASMLGSARKMSYICRRLATRITFPPEIAGRKVYRLAYGD